MRPGTLRPCHVSRTDRPRDLQGHYGSFISITKSAQTAEKLFTASPLTYAVATERKAFDTSLADLSATGEALPHTHLVENTAPPDDANIEQKTFTLEVVPAPDYNHEMTFARLPEHNSWPASYTSKSSFMTAALQQSLPDDITTKGFARWDNDPDDLGAPSRKNERVALAAWMPSTMKKSSERRD